MKITGAILAAVLVLSGCSGGGEGDSVQSGQDVADMIGCSGFTDDSEEMYVTEGGSCTLGGEDVYAYYFSSKSDRDSWVKVASQFGGPYLVGEGWVVDAPESVLDGIKADHGGELSD